MAKGKATARRKLELSRLSLTKRELMGEDIDIESFKLQMKGALGLNVVRAIIEADVERTIEGASTLTVAVQDHDRTLGRSGFLHARKDVKVDGLWFRLAKVQKQGDTLTLTFEDREVAVLKTYDKIIKASNATSRSKTTRAEFVLRMIREVKEFSIPWVIPELEQVQPIEEAADTGTFGGNTSGVASGGGIPKQNSAYPSPGSPEDTRGIQTPGSYPSPRSPEDARGMPPGRVTVKGEVINENQRRIANTILDVGASTGASTDENIMAIMCATQESTMRNLRQPKPGDYNYLSDDPHHNPVGVFQQIQADGWPASRDVAKDAKAFFDALKTVVKRFPSLTFGEKVDKVQVAGTPNLFEQWKAEATRTVAAYGDLPTDQSPAANNQQPFAGGQGDYEFYRGVPPATGAKNWQHENSWACALRLAEEVNWRTFFVSGTFYYISEGELFKTKPIANITEGVNGIDNIDYDYDEGKQTSDCTVTCRMSRWDAPPGSIIKIHSMGVIDGRWLVSNVKRSLFSSSGEITLKKPRPKLPEPLGSNVSQTGGTPTTDRSQSTSTAPDVKNAADGAKQILQYHQQGKYRDDNGQQLSQLKKIANGQQLTSQCGTRVYMHPAVMSAILLLLENGFYVGTFALCEDHHCNDGQHPKGQAVDISSLGTLVTGWHSLNAYSPQATALAKQAMELLGPTAWDLICNGVGRYDRSVQALQKDNGHTQGGVWASDHINHMHMGVVPSAGAPGQ
jgi:hypothetical protein